MNRIPNTFRKHHNGGKINRHDVRAERSTVARLFPPDRPARGWPLGALHGGKRSASTGAQSNPGTSRRRGWERLELRLHPRPQSRSRKASKTTCPFYPCPRLAGAPRSELRPCRRARQGRKSRAGCFCAAHRPRMSGP